LNHIAQKPVQGCVRGLLLRHPDVDLVRIQDVELAGADDPSILAGAAANDRIVLTQDRATMLDYAFERAAEEIRCTRMLPPL
jgi:predicted nuclease of predicted toxin-antitoxin system